MEDRDRAEVLAEILDERLASVRHLLDEWSVPQAEALTYAQAKDLIWQLFAPFGLAMLGYRVAERALREEPYDPALRSALERFTQTGEAVGNLLERFLAAAGEIRP